MARYCVAFVVLAAVLMAAPAPAGPAGLPAAVAERVKQLVPRLDDPSAQVREDAEVALCMLPPEALPALEEASKRDDLSPEASARVGQILGRQKRWIPARLRRAAQLRAEWKWHEESALRDYRAVGKHNAAWDALAEDAIRKFVVPPDFAEQGAARAALDKAISAGCDDPLLLYLHARRIELDDNLDPGRLDELYQRAVIAMEKSKYSPYRKCVAIIRFYYCKWEYEGAKAKSSPKPTGHLPPDVVDMMCQHLHEAQRLWPQAVTEPGAPIRDILEIGHQILRAYSTLPGDWKVVLDHVIAPLEQTFPDRVEVQAFKGRFYEQYAWLVLPNHSQANASEEQLRLMRERLEIAKQILQKAWERDPTQSEPPTLMLALVMSLHEGREAEDLWFNRAMDADPDNKDACDRMLWALDPYKWPDGDQQQMLAFARKCFDGQNWYARIPWLLVDAHDVLAKESGDEDEYYGQPAVWQDLRRVYDPYLRVSPDDAATRSRFAYFACRCRQWAEARRQFDLLGDNAVAYMFDGEERMQEYRRMAREQPKSQTTVE